MINFVKNPGQRVLELGGGFNRHPLSDVNIDVRSGPGVDFTVDFDKPEWPEVSSDEFDIVYCCFCLEHIAYTNTKNFLKQSLRVLKPGGKAIFVIPNTEAQMKYILSKASWDGDESCMLFGQQDYVSNAHKAAFSPTTTTKLFTEAGFTNIIITPFGALATDMIVEAVKPGVPISSEPVASPPPSATLSPVQPPPVPSPAPSAPPPPQPTRPASEIYNLAYLERYQGGGWYWDFPNNYLIAKRILERNPASVLELGCSRGYVLKRIQDAGIPVQGIDVSRASWLTRVCDPIHVHDLTTFPWPVNSQAVDLCVSVSLLEHIPERFLPAFAEELKRVAKRGLHGVTLEGMAPNHDPTRCTLKTLDFWKKVLPEGHEVVDIRELGSGDLPQEYVNGDGTIRLNIGCAFTHFFGYTNIDVIDAENFAKAYRQRYLRHDVRNGIPTSTGVVDAIFAHHFCEHLSYEELARFLKECRRVIRPDGCMRLVVPDAGVLAEAYTSTPPHLSYFNEMNIGTAKAPTNAGKLWSLLAEGHKSFLDEETLFLMLDETGWVPHKASFRQTEVPAVQRVLKECTEMTYGNSSCFVDATPKLGGSL